MRLLRRSFHSLLAMTDEFRIYCDETPPVKLGYDTRLMEF